MKEVELKLVANNQPAVNSIRQLANESQKLYTDTEKSQKRQVGLIADIEKELGRLQNAQKNAMSIEALEKYNRKIAEAKMALQEYEKAGISVEKQGTTMMQSIGKWALGIGAVTTAVGLLKEALAKTQQGMILFSEAAAATNKVLSNIVNGVANWNEGVMKAIVLARQMALLKMEDKRDSLEINRLMREYNELYNEGFDIMKSTSERLELLTKAKAKYIQATEKEIADTERMLKNVMEQWKNDPTNYQLESQAIDLKNRIEELHGSMFSGTRKLTRQITALEKSMWDDLGKIVEDFNKNLQKEIDDRVKEEEEAQKKLNDKRLKQEEEYQKTVNELIDRYTKSNIESLSGVDKLKAQRNFELNELAILKTHLTNFGPITDNQQAMLEKMWADVWKKYTDAMVKEAKVTPTQREALSKALLEGMPKLEGLQKTNTIIPSKPIGSIWQLIGIDPDTDDGKKEIEAIKKVYDTTITTLNNIYKAKVDDATRLRELAQNRVSDAESALNSEIELYKAGYASNVAAKQKELDDLKKKRDKAAEDEAAAVRQQRALDTITQVSSLITASAQTFKAFPGPLLPIAIAVVGAMFGAFALSKIKAASITKLAAGGRGEVTGRLHSEGGERFLDHVEIEQGEKWGVLSRSASRKYGNTFYKMVDSFNRDALPVPRQGIINNILLDTSMTNERLDELIKLNKKEKSEDIIISGGMTIIKKGSVTRIIRR